MEIRLSPSQLHEFTDLFIDTGCTTSCITWTLDGSILVTDYPEALAQQLAGWEREPDECGTDPDDRRIVRERNKAFRGIKSKLGFPDAKICWPVSVK